MRDHSAERVLAHPVASPHSGGANPQHVLAAAHVVDVDVKLPRAVAAVVAPAVSARKTGRELRV